MSVGPSPAPPGLVSRRVRGVVFDLDGTLVDSYEAIRASLNHARAHWSLSPLPLGQVRRQVGHGLETLIADLVGPDRVEPGVRLFRERYAEVFRRGTRILPGVGPTLEVLEQLGLKLAVASNKPARFTVPILEHLGIGGHFAVVEGPDTAGCTKPDPVMLHRCLTRLGVKPEAAVYVGDMVLDVTTAGRAGLPVILVPGGSSDPESLKATEQPVAARFADLVGLLSQTP